MDLRVGVRAEALAADGAREGPLLGVRGEVDVQRGLGEEPLVAQRAAQRLGAHGVHHAHVLVAVLEVCNQHRAYSYLASRLGWLGYGRLVRRRLLTLIADLAEVELAQVVHQHVASPRRLRHEELGALRTRQAALLVRRLVRLAVRVHVRHQLAAQRAHGAHSLLLHPHLPLHLRFCQTNKIDFTLRKDN